MSALDDLKDKLAKIPVQERNPIEQIVAFGSYYYSHTLDVDKREKAAAELAALKAEVVDWRGRSQVWAGAKEVIDELQAENAKLREQFLDLLHKIQMARKASMGSIDNVYLPQLDRQHIDELTTALSSSGEKG